MDPIYDREGTCVGWLDAHRVLNLRGGKVAKVKERAVFDPSGTHLGWFDEGFFRDRRGGAVAFVEGATGGPITPITRFAPFPPMSSVHRSLRSDFSVRITRIPPIMPIGSLRWGIRWDDFLSP